MLNKIIVGTDYGTHVAQAMLWFKLIDASAIVLPAIFVPVAPIMEIMGMLNNKNCVNG